MRHLYLQFYVALVAILVVFGVLVFATWLLLPPSAERQQLITGSAAVLSDLLPAQSRPISETQDALDRLHGQLGVSLSLYAGDGELVAFAGEVLAAPDLSGRDSGFIHGAGRGPRVALHLDDGRWLIVRAEREHGASWLAKLALLAIAVAIGAYPIVRRITRRLERLRTAVDELGSGGLATRVPVEGRDEIADVARSFNRAAERIEALVNAQRRVLASASHELRTPLTRLRMALALLGRTGEEELLASAERDVEELDALIGDVLTAAHLEGTPVASRSERVELLDLVADEATRLQASVSGEPVAVRGDPKLLRRLVRNLVDNAVRHAGGEVEVSVARLPEAEGACLRVADRGPGIPEGERLRIFEPFYRPSGHSEGRDGGVGLGLALVAEIARHHGGDAVCRSRPGGGTIFEVILRHPPNSL